MKEVVKYFFEIWYNIYIRDQESINYVTNWGYGKS